MLLVNRVPCCFGVSAECLSFLVCRLAAVDFSTGAGDADSVCYLQAGAQVQHSAKSYSFASQRKQQYEQSEKLQAAQQTRQQQRPGIKYDSISQFSQRVELYRGRCADTGSAAGSCMSMW